VPDFTQATVHAIFVAAIYDGVRPAPRADWPVEFLKKPGGRPNLGATACPRCPAARKEIVGKHRGAAFAVKTARLIDSFAAGDFE